MALDDLIMTIDSDAEVDVADELEPGPSKKTARKKDKAKATNEDTGDKDVINPSFTFDVTGDVYDDVLGESSKEADLVKGSKATPISVDDIIARRKLKGTSLKRKREDEPEEDDEDKDEDEDLEDGDELVTDDEEETGDEHLGDEASDDPLDTSDEEGGENDEDAVVDSGNESSASDDEDGDDSEQESQAQKDRKAAFFASPDDPSLPSTSASTLASFSNMSLSRPLLKALSSLNFTSPTPIQAATIPVALLGKDVVGNAVTGSGKTAAFMLPILERLMYRERGKNKAAVRCVVLVPTRELGVQCADGARKLSAFMDVRIALIVGGLSLKSQEAELRTRPDIVIATPGRLIDHLRNTPSFGLETLDVLVLDEADRMLEDGFADELQEIVRACAESRQTMLFSATMTDDVDALVKMSLRKPVRLFVDPKRVTAKGLVQEFVRVRERPGKGREEGDERAALLVALCKKTCKEGVLVFFRSKKLAHQMRVAFGILGMKTEELHGDLTQEQRLRALQAFRDGTVEYLMATDLASRGLDIKGIETVINYDMPGQHAQYLHRVGRTARAGKKGRSITLVGEADRKMLKAAIKHSSDADKVRHRTVPPERVAQWAAKMGEIKDEISEVLKEEKEEKAMRQAEMELKKKENIMEHEKEIFSRPARTWFQSEKDKKSAQETSKKEYETAAGVNGISSKSKGKESADADKPKRDKFAGLSRRAKRRKMAMEDDEGETGTIRAAVRSVKKASRPTPIGMPEAQSTKSKDKKGKGKAKAKAKAKSASVTARRGSAFERDMGDKRGVGGRSFGASTRREGTRSSKGDKIGGMGKKGAKGKRK